MYAPPTRAVLVWSMGITQHEHGVDNVHAIVNLGARARQRRPAGRGRSCRSAATPACRAAPRWAATRRRSRAASPITDGDGGRRSRDAVGLRRCRSRPGLTAADDGRRGAARRPRRALVERRQLPRRAARARRHARPRSARTPLRIHQDILVTHQMLVDPGETVVLLPAATRYEQEGGGTSTTTERRVAFSPEMPGPRVGEARSEWRDLRRRRAPGPSRARADCSAARRPTRSAPRSRASSPRYAGIEKLRDDRRRDPGRRRAPLRRRRVPDARRQGPLRASSCRTSARRARGRFVLSTRRGKQFNSMVWEDVDPLTGAARDALFVVRRRRRPRSASPTATRCSCGQPHGEMRARVHLAPIRPGNVQAFFPEANPLLVADASASRSRACPTTTRSSRWSRSR